MKKCLHENDQRRAHSRRAAALAKERRIKMLVQKPRPLVFRDYVPAPSAARVFDQIFGPSPILRLKSTIPRPEAKP